MGKFTKKINKKSVSVSLNAPFYRVEYSVKNGNHFFTYYDYNDNQIPAMIPGPLYEDLTRDEDPQIFRKEFMRGFGDNMVILACMEDMRLREVFEGYTGIVQLFLMWGCGAYHETILNDSNTQEDIEGCYNSIFNSLASFGCGAEKWFEAYTKTFVDMGNQIGWSPVAMKLEA